MEIFLGIASESPVAIRLDLLSLLQGNDQWPFAPDRKMRKKTAGME